MPINVVYEYNKTAGGLFGVRTWTSYKDEREFNESKKYQNQDVLKKDVTDDEAINLVSLTPEISRLMGSLEQVFSESENPSMERVMFAIQNAQYAIVYDRERILEFNLERIDAQKYIEHFKAMSEANPPTHKSISIKSLLIMILDKVTGEVL